MTLFGLHVTLLEFRVTLHVTLGRYASCGERAGGRRRVQAVVKGNTHDR
jgi:hypothetical protein